MFWKESRVKRTRFTEEQIIGALQKMASGRTAADDPLQVIVPRENECSMFRETLRADLVPSTLKTGVQFGAAWSQRRDGALDLRFTFANVGVGFLLMGEVEGNRPVHVLQVERREVLANGFRRLPGLEGTHDGSRDTRVPAA